MSFCLKKSFCPYTVLSWIALLSPSSAEYLEPIYFVDGDIYSTSVFRAEVDTMAWDKFGPQNAFRRQLSINETDDFAGSWVSGYFQQCDPNWKAWNDKLDSPKNCAIYAQKNYCTKDGEKGSAYTWDFEDYTNLQSGGGKTAFACPQCGCKQESAMVWIDFKNSGEIVAKFSFRNRREKGSDENNPLEFRLFGADVCPVSESPEFVNKVIIQDYNVASDKWSGNDMEMTFPVDPDNRQRKRCVGIEITQSSGGLKGGEKVAIQNIKMWTDKRIEGIHRLVKKTQMLEMLVLNILDTLESRVVCQTGNVGCKPCGAKDENDNYITFYERYPVTFSPSFKKVPKVTMAVNYFYSIASGWKDWYHYKTVAKKVTIDGFEANLELGDAETMNRLRDSQ